MTVHDEAITLYSNPFCVQTGNKQVLRHEVLILLLIIWHSISSQLKTHMASTTEIPEQQWKGYDITLTFHSRNQEKWPTSKYYKVTRNAWLQTFQTVFLLGPWSSGLWHMLSEKVTNILEKPCRLNLLAW